MAVTRRDPVKEMIALREKMNRLMEESLAHSGVAEEEANPGAWSPAVDIFEEEDRIVLRADLPGVGSDQLDIRVANNTLTISGERGAGADLRKETCHRMERQYGRFSRSFSLPGSVDAEKIRAEHRDGVLEVSLPKREDDRSRKIDIQAR